MRALIAGIGAGLIVGCLIALAGIGLGYVLGVYA